jgi:hypothetical protein
MPWLSLGIVTIDNEEGVPARGNEHPRALALAPGGESGAESTAMAIRAGAEMAAPNGRRHNNCARLTEYLNGVLHVCVSGIFGIRLPEQLSQSRAKTNLTQCPCQS